MGQMTRAAVWLEVDAKQLHVTAKVIAGNPKPMLFSTPHKILKFLSTPQLKPQTCVSVGVLSAFSVCFIFMAQITHDTEPAYCPPPGKTLAHLKLAH